MREILFRGFHESESGKEVIFVVGKQYRGEWVYGSVVVNDNTNLLGKPENQCFIVDRAVRVHGSVYFNVMLCEVLPETVGQYIRNYGKSGKCDKKIFQHDKVRFTYFGEIHIGKVTFNEITCVFEVWFNSAVGAYGEQATHKLNFAHLNIIEVCGTVFDMEGK